MAAEISPFLLSWWYTPNTRLAIRFQTSVATFDSGTTGFLDASNGLSASIQEDYNYENDITDNPVEIGVNTSDHIIIKPRNISITGLLSAVDIIPLLGTGALNFNQLGEAVKFLDTAARQRTLFSLTTGLYFGRSFFTIPNVAIKSLNIPRNNQYGRTTIKFNISFKEVIITDTSATTTTNSSSQGTLAPSAGGVD